MSRGHDGARLPNLDLLESREGSCLPHCVSPVTSSAPARHVKGPRVDNGKMVTHGLESCQLQFTEHGKLKQRRSALVT